MFDDDKGEAGGLPVDATSNAGACSVDGERTPIKAKIMFDYEMKLEIFEMN